MEVTALCITLLINAILVAKVHNSNGQKYDAGFPHIFPNRLQFFLYESISVNCVEFGGPHEWRVMRKRKEFTPTNASSWKTSTRCRTIQSAYPADSGVYWCEDEEGERSNAVNITVTDGEVILDIPVLPVTKGDDVTLRCRMENTSHLIAEFYKDGTRVGTGYKGEMNIPSVSKFNEGLYKCSISGAGESPESWLAVRGPHSFHIHSPHLSALLWILISISVATPLLLVVGLLYCEKRKGTRCSPEESVVYSSVYYWSVRAETSD